MNETKKIRQPLESLWQDWYEGPLEKAIEILTKLQEHYADMDGELILETAYEDDVSWPKLMLVRNETSEEKKKRMRYERGLKQERIKSEKEEYERLKAKYGH